MSGANWITDRQPTKADGDFDGDVFIQPRPGSTNTVYIHWSYVGLKAPWKRTDHWQPPASEPEPEPEPQSQATPRRFVSISRTVLDCEDHIIDAIDDEGVAWWLRTATSSQWHRMTPLPAREVPTDG